MPSSWIEVLLPVGLLAVIVLALRRGLFARHFRAMQARRLVCPALHEEVDCRIEQEVYTGRWERVAACSAYPGAADVPCDEACVKRMNLGFPLTPRRALHP